MEYPFIVLEGTDGTGKSTISKMLAEEISGMALATPLEPHKTFRPQFNPETFIPEEHFDFYLESVEFASQQIEIISQVMPVVCDRYWISTYAYHIGMGLDVMIAKQKLENKQLKIPQATFLLECNDEILEERLRKRGSRPLRKDWLTKIRNIYSEFDLDIIDTSKLTQNEVVLEIKRRLHRSKLIINIES